MHRHSISTTCVHSRIFWGFILLISGVLLLGFNSGFLPTEYKSWVFSFPTALTLIGLLFLLKRAYILALLLWTFAAFLFAPRFGITTAELRSILLPFLLIIIGIKVIIRSQRHRNKKESTLVNNRSERIDKRSFFESYNERFTGESFKGGEINNLFGVSHLDLTQTQLEPGITILDISCVFAGVHIIVPSTWHVQLQTNSIFGEFVEKGRSDFEIKDSNKTLLIRGSFVFAGGELKYQS